MPALRVSKPSGMGGAGNSWGPGEEAGFPGGGMGVGTRDCLPGDPKLT